VRSGFQRNYFIFVNEDTGYEAGQKPSGHLKVEVRDGRGRLHAAVQNLRPGNGRFEYALYLLRAGSLPKALVHAGNFGFRPGNAEIEWIFDPSDVGRSGVPIEGFDVFAVVAENTGGLENSLACPLAAYRNKRVDWRNDFRMSRMVKKPVQSEIIPVPKFEAKPEAKPETKPETKPEKKAEPEIKPKAGLAHADDQPQYQQTPAYIGDQPQTYQESPAFIGGQPQAYQETPALAGDQPQYQQTPAYIGDRPQIYQYSADQQTIQSYGAVPEQQYEQGLPGQFEQTQPYIPYPAYQEQPLNTYDPYQMYAQQPQVYDPYQAYPQPPVQPYGPVQPFEVGQGQEYQDAVQQPEEPAREAVEDDNTAQMPQENDQQPQANDQQPQENDRQPQANLQQPQDNVQQPRENIQQPQSAEAEQDQTTSQPEYQHISGPGSINTGCLYLNGNICGAFLNTAQETASPCETCKANHRGATGQMQPAGDLSRLRAILDLNFEENDPFHSKRSDYMWWKITNPVNLNNILYQNNIRSPLMFNPAVMLAHYKYHHLIVGIFTRRDGRKYVVCGVPGMHMVDRKPFGDMSKWVQADGGRPRYGAFGYWLVYINPEDGKILDLNQD